MPSFTPVPSHPTATQATASTALDRLSTWHALLSSELQALPIVSDTLLEALTHANHQQLQQEATTLLQRLDDYWSAPTLQGESRRDWLISGMHRTMRDEATLKSHEDLLAAEYATCIPSLVDLSVAPLSDPSISGAFSLHVQLTDEHRVEINGAMVMLNEQGLTLLALPGTGLKGFASQAVLLENVVEWLNDSDAQVVLRNTLQQRDQAILAQVISDPELLLEPFILADVELQAIDGNPFLHAVSRQLDKQREDLRHACEQALEADAPEPLKQIGNALGMQGLLGPGGMLELRELAYIDRRQRAALPDWVKIAPAADLEQYVQRVQRYDQARLALISTLDGASSPQQFADLRLRSRIADDLGYDVNPVDIQVSTRRSLPWTAEHYTVSRSLPQLALYGLHPGDREDGSAFLNQTAITVRNGIPGTAYSALTAAYIARVIEELDLRATFGEFQRTAYATPYNQQAMRNLTRQQISAQAYAAKMQGHILPGDFDFIEAITQTADNAPDTRLQVQQIKLDNRDILSSLLVFRKENQQAQLDRLVLFTPNAPRAESFQCFDNENQLRNELVAWTRSPAMSHYLLQQVQVSSRAPLEQTLMALKEKPYPQSDYVQLLNGASFDESLQAFVDSYRGVAIAEQLHHTPEWYLQASTNQRQELLALEDAAAGAAHNHDARPHNRLQTFDTYLHERASQQIASLLNVAAGSVDPDLIVITTERETLTYTQMLRNGYDDSLGFIQSSADTQATFSGPPGVDLSRLTPASVAGSVRGKWPGDDYITLIKSTLLNENSPDYDYRRRSNLLLTQLQMQAAALRSSMKGQIDAQQYQWLKPVLDNAHLSDAANRQRFPLYPLQLHVDKPLIGSGLTGVDQLVIPSGLLTHTETVEGCYIMQPTEIRLSALLFTPKAPDGIEFRLFSSFTESLGSDGMIDYYKDRCRLQAGRTLSFFLNDMKQGNASKAPVIPRDGFADFAHACFESVIERKLLNVEQSTTGRSEMLTRLVWTSVEIISTVITLPFPPASFAVGALFALHDSMRALNALTEGDQETASVYVLGSLLNSLGAAGDLHSGLKGFGGALRRLDKRAGHSSILPSPSTATELPTYAELYPVRLEDQPFWIGKTNANGHAPVYSNNAQASDLQNTGHFAQQDSAGNWQPLGPRTVLPASGTTDGAIGDLALNISLQDVPAITSGHATGVSIVNGQPHIKLQGRVYQVQYDAHQRHWNIIDPANPFAFFGKQPVALNSEHQWQLIKPSHLSGGGLDAAGSFKPLLEEAAGSNTAVSTVSDFELPQQMRGYLDALLVPKNYDPTGMGIEHYFEQHFAGMRQTFATLRENLYREAKAFFAQPHLPVRPALPTLENASTTESLVSRIYEACNGLVISEIPRSVASKRLLILNMPFLAEQRVEVLYIEHLFTDKHIRKLNKYRTLGSKSRAGSQELKFHLEDLNGGILDNASQEYDYYHLIKTAHRHNIEVRPLSSSISYPFAGHPVASASGDATAVQKMSNFLGHKIISEDVAANPSRRWIALLDQKLANTHQDVPGITELEGVISIRIEDIAVSLPTRISREADNFKLELNNPTMRLVSPIPVQISPLDKALQHQFEGATAALDSNAYAGRHGFVLDVNNDWKRIDVDSWIADSPPTAIQQSLVDPIYEMPLVDKDILHDLAEFQRKGLDSDYFFGDSQVGAVRDDFFVRRAQLNKDAQHIIFSKLSARPDMPEVSAQTSLEDFLTSLYQATDGVVIGESHASIASKKLIIDNLPMLNQQNVKTLYMEHLLTDLHQADLDRFFETGQMSKTLLFSLKRLDRGHFTDPSGLYTFEKLVIHARAHGIEVRAIDCTASYHLKGINNEVTATRQKMMNYFASRTVRKHQDVMGSHKWIALVGNSHVNTFRQIVPGIAELEGGIGVRVVDVRPGQGTSVARDPGDRLQVELSLQNVVVKSDYRVAIETDYKRIAPDAQDRPPLPLPLEQRLAKPGMFMIEQGDDGEQVIVHRARDLAIHRTLIQLDTAGKIHVDRSSWSSVHLQPYEDVDALIQALKLLNLTHIS